MLDVTEVGDVKPAKRRTLLLCLLYQAQVKTRDYLVEMFLKRMRTLHNRAKAKLVELRERHRAQTEALLKAFTDVLVVSNASPDFASLEEQVEAVLNLNGGAGALLEQCEEIAAYKSDNYLPLLWRFYSRYRKLLFTLVRSLDIHSTTQDQSLVEALAFVLEHEHRRGQWLSAQRLDLSFVSDQWRRLVLVKKDGAEVAVRRQLEICIFTYLATELKTGDVCVVGSESYADFREQLLSWQECQPQLESFCQNLGIPSEPDGFITHLTNWLAQTAIEVDQVCPTMS